MARMTYMGNCILDGVVIPCSSMNSGIETSPSFYDHTIGLKDTGFDGSDVKTESTGDDVGGYKQIQKKIYRYLPAIFKCKIAGPISDNGTKINIEDFIEAAIKGTKISSSEFIYINSFSGGTPEGHKVTDLYVESVNLNMVSGDVSTFDISMVSKDEPSTPTSSATSSECSKLLTWDKCSVSCAIPGDIQGFNLSLKNNIIPIYTSTESKTNTSQYIAAKAIRFGMQEVTGTVSTYGFNVWNKTSDEIAFAFGSSSWKINVIYSPTASSASGGSEPYVSSTPFHGASDVPVWIEE